MLVSVPRFRMIKAPVDEAASPTLTLLAVAAALLMTAGLGAVSTNTSSPAVGTALGVQLPVVNQSLEAAPVQSAAAVADVSVRLADRASPRAETDDRRRRVRGSSDPART